MNMIIRFSLLLAAIGAFSQAFSICSIPISRDEIEGGVQIQSLSPESSGADGFSVRNGDALGFSCQDIFADTIRFVSGFNAIPNPLGLSHSGVVILDDPKNVFDLIYRLTPNATNRGYGCTISENAGRYMLEELQEYYASELSLVQGEVLHPFVVEASGTAATVLRGIYPHVQLHPFEKTVKEYDGNIYLRSTKMNIPLDFTRNFTQEYIGRSYETLFTLPELVRAATERNTTESTQYVFCSELLGLFYRDAINQFHHGKDKNSLLKLYKNVSNIIPEQFGSGAGNRDLLRGIAEPEREIWHKFDLESGEETDCLSQFFRSIFRG